MSDVGPARNIAVKSDAAISPRKELKIRVYNPIGLASERPTKIYVDTENKRISLQSNSSYGEEYLTIVGDQVFQGLERSRHQPFLQYVPATNLQVESSTDPFIESSIADYRRQVALSQRLRAQIAAAVQENDPDDPEFDRKIAAFVDTILWRHGADSIGAFRDFISDPKVSTELRHVFLFALACADHDESKSARRSLIASFLDSPDASARYSAVLALGEMKSETSLVLLSKRKKVEQNRAVSNLIEAYLR